MPEFKTEAEWRKWLQRRIKRAAAYKAETCGKGEIGPGFFHDEEGKKAKAKFTSEGKARQARNMKAKNGGIIGVCTDAFSSYVVSHPGGRRQRVKCPVAGALIRNAAAEKKYPGMEEFKCDLGAVWERWGCKCGKHRRGREHESH